MIQIQRNSHKPKNTLTSRSMLVKMRTSARLKVSFLCFAPSVIKLNICQSCCGHHHTVLCAVIGQQSQRWPSKVNVASKPIYVTIEPSLIKLEFEGRKADKLLTEIGNPMPMLTIRKLFVNSEFFWYIWCIFYTFQMLTYIIYRGLHKSNDLCNDVVL